MKKPNLFWFFFFAIALALVVVAFDKLTQDLGARQFLEGGVLYEER